MLGSAGIAESHRADTGEAAEKRRGWGTLCFLFSSS